MFKVIVADDERYICQLISTLINWEQIGFELVGMAEDGLSALKMIKEKKPDVVITDIRMPEMDGMDIVRQTKELGIDVSFVIISGHKCFEYAQNALKYGVEDYLLKPIKKTELQNILMKIRDRLLVERSQKDKKAFLETQLMHSIDQLRDQFFVRLLADIDAGNGELNLEQINTDYHMTLSDGAFRVIIVKLDSKDQSRLSDDYLRICSEKFVDIMDQYLRQDCYDIQPVQKNTYILNYSSNNKDIICKNLKFAFKEMNRFLEGLNLSTITIGAGKEVSGLNGLFESGATAAEAVRFRIEEGSNKIIEYSSKKYFNLKMADWLTPSKERMLGNVIDSLDFYKLKELIIEMFDELSSIDRVNPTMYYQTSEKIFSIFVLVMNKIGQKIKDDYLENLKDELDLSECKTSNEIKNVLLERISSIFDYYNNHQKTNAPVRVAISYIARNYNKIITLNKIAELVNLNPVYFSIIFKKEMGINFIDYVVTYRMEAAKKLLENFQYNIAQVSEMVGYSDPKHFSRSFKKRVGINPVEYRRIHS